MTIESTRPKWSSLLERVIHRWSQLPEHFQQLIGLHLLHESFDQRHGQMDVLRDPLRRTLRHAEGGLERQIGQDLGFDPGAVNVGRSFRRDHSLLIDQWWQVGVFIYLCVTGHIQDLRMTKSRTPLASDGMLIPDRHQWSELHWGTPDKQNLSYAT